MRSAPSVPQLPSAWQHTAAGGQKASGNGSRLGGENCSALVPADNRQEQQKHVNQEALNMAGESV